MDTSRVVRLLVIMLASLLVIGAMGCSREPSEPAVVGTTPEPEPQSEPEAELRPTPLAGITIALEPVLDGFDQPLYATGIPDGSGTLVVLEKTGRAVTVADGTREGVFLDLSAAVSTESEQGLLGLAFAPTFSDDGVFYASYTDRSGTSVVSRFTARDGVADPASEQVLLTVTQPYKNHNGGMIAFGPDGYLYFGLGDGGSGGDPQGNGQNTLAMLGKMLRIDVSGGGATYAIPPDNPFAGDGEVLPEIWASGLRNPWRFSFDRKTGDLWIGDVGQNAWEEIDFQPASSAGGENYGWNLMEATHPYPPEATPPDAAGLTMPVVEYDRQAGTSVTGGYVYRGAAQPTLWGTYLYADFSVGRIWGLQRAADGSVQTRLLLESGMLISSFGEDEAGELYVVDFNGGVYRVVAK